MTDAQTQADAVIVNATMASRAELQRAVSSIVGAPVTLADDALTRASTLTIERTPMRDPSGRRIEAREIDPPHLFRLVKRGTSCVLIHERTQQEVVLRETECDD